MQQDFLMSDVIRQDMEHIYARGTDFSGLKGKGIYVTGATGMIASYFVMFLIFLNEKKDFQIRIYAGARSREKAEQRFGKYVEAEYFHLILRDVTEAVPEEVQADFIVHAASLASPQYYGSNPVETMLPNVLGTCELLKYAKERNAEGFLFFSSGNVYGSLKVQNQPTITEDLIGTMDFLSIGNSYGESKRCGEALCMAYFREYGIPVKIARIHHTYGPTMDVWKDKRVFAEFTANLLRSEDIHLKSDGTAKRAFCYLEDAILALFTILLKGEEGQCYNLGNNREYVTISELAQRLVKLYPEQHLQVIFENRTDQGYAASPESRVTPLDLKKLEALGWEPKVGIEEGFRRTVEYYRS